MRKSDSVCTGNATIKYLVFARLRGLVSLLLSILACTSALATTFSETVTVAPAAERVRLINTTQYWEPQSKFGANTFFPPAQCI